MIEYLSLALILVIIGILVYALNNALNKIETYEQFIRDRRDAYSQLLQNIRDIDSRELFEKDDDVGSVFTEIKNEIENFKNIIE
jgi:ABC-type multidrug transport system fused ATPase/permease subunit